MKFRRGRIPRFDEHGVRLEPVLPAGRILERTDGPVMFRDEEISRAGVHVTRTPVLTRWHGGGVFGWTSRRAQTGQGDCNLRSNPAEDRHRIDRPDPSRPEDPTLYLRFF